MSKAAAKSKLREKLGVEKTFVGVEKTRSISQKSMIHNGATPNIEIIPKPMRCAPDGELFGPALRRNTLPMAQRYFCSDMRAISVKPAGHWTGDAADSVVLDYDDRQRRRVALTGTKGLEFLLDLQEVAGLRSGDALVLDDGRLVEVVSAPEPMLEIKCSDPLHLARVAWHLGNRHLPTQIMRRRSAFAAIT